MDKAQPRYNTGERVKYNWKNRVVAAVGALSLSLGLIPSDTSSSVRYEAPHTSIAHDNHECPPNSQFGVMHLSGAGQNNIGEFAAAVTGDILGDDYDECEAALNYGTNYSSRLNAWELDNFVEKNKFHGVVLVAQSFGGLAAVDMLREYHSIRPESDTKFSIVFVSSLSGMQDLHFLQWLSANALTTIPLNEEAVYSMTWLGTIGQGGKDPSDPGLKKDISSNAGATPPTLLEEQMQRLSEGMSTLPADMNIQAYYIGDLKDGVVKVEQAPRNIERASGVKMNEVYIVNHPDGSLALDSHADLWWLPYVSVWRNTVRKTVSDAANKMGVKTTADAVCEPGDKPVMDHPRGIVLCA